MKHSSALLVLILGAYLGGLSSTAQQKTQSESDSIKTMAADAYPSFEVATVKPTDPGDRNSGFHVDGQHIWIEAQTINQILTFAFDVHAQQIIRPSRITRLGRGPRRFLRRSR